MKVKPGDTQPRGPSSSRSQGNASYHSSIVTIFQLCGSPPAVKASDQREYSEALTQYRNGLRLEPNNSDLLSRKSLAEAAVGDYVDAEEDGEKAIAAGGSLRFPIVHNHIAGFCSGNLVLERGKVSFLPQSGDHGFAVTSSGQLDITESTFTHTNLPEFLIHWRSQDSKDHKYYMVVTTYLTRKGGSSVIPGTFQADGDAVDKTSGLDRMILTLIKKSVP